MPTVRPATPDDLGAMTAIWNEVVEEGIAFPQEESLSLDEARAFFASQSRSAVAVRQSGGKILGLYILHPNNVGRCGHICNASYAVSSESPGLRIREKLVRDCIATAPKFGYRVLQFNAVVATNTRARRLYEKLGFTQLGVIPGGFRMKDGHYEDICPYYIKL
jgi:L-amino acid N-acyltransferase YncA